MFKPTKNHDTVVPRFLERARRIVRCLGIFGPNLIHHAVVIAGLQTMIWTAAIAPWLRLRLPSCGPRFESRAHHLCFFQFDLLKLKLRLVLE